MRTLEADLATQTVAGHRLGRPAAAASPPPLAADRAMPPTSIDGTPQGHSHGDRPASEGPPWTPTLFSTDITGLPEAVPTAVLELDDGDELELRHGPVAKRLGDDDRAHARLQRLDPRPHARGPAGLRGRRARHQRHRPRHHRALARAAPGEPLRRGAARDPGSRSRRAGTSPTASSSPTRACTGTTRTSARTSPRRLGLYGSILVEPAEPDYWPPAHRDVVLTLDDLLLEDGVIAPFSRTETNYAAMGRYGNVMLTGGETAPALTARDRRGGAALADQHRQQPRLPGPRCPERG